MFPWPRQALRDTKGLAVCGRVYFACRPPPPAGESAAVAQARAMMGGEDGLGLPDMGDVA